MSNIIVIKSIKLHNILSHEHTYIEFPLGLTAIVGPNGAGKSSIIDAAIYSLFVNPQSIRSLRGSSRRSIVRIGASSGSIEVELSIGGKKYSINRNIDVSKSDDAALYEIQEDGKKRKLVSGVQPVLDYVKKLLSIPSFESIRYTIISRQNEIAKLIEEPPSIRKEIILKLLGLDELEKAKEILKQYLDSVKTDIKLYENAKIELNEIKKKIEEITKTLEKDRSELEKLEIKLQSLELEIKKYEELTNLLKFYDKFSKAIEIINEIKEIETILPICREILNLKIENYISVAEMLKKSKEMLNKALEEFNGIENEIKIILEKLKNEINIELYSIDSREITEYLDELIKKMYVEESTKQVELNVVTQSIDIVEKSSNCPLCQRELDDNLKKHIIFESEKRVKKIKHELDLLIKIRKRIEQYLEMIKKFNERKIEARIRIENSKKIVEEYSKKYEEMKNNIEEIINKVKNIRIFMKCLNEENNIAIAKCLYTIAIESIKLYEEKKLMLNKLLGNNISLSTVTSKYEEIKRRIFELGFSNDINVAEVEEKYRKYLNEVNEIKKKIGQIEGRIESYTKIQKEFIDKEKEILEKLDRYKKSVDIYPALDFIVNELLGKEGYLAKKLTQKARKLIEKYSNIILNELGMDFKIQINDEFDISVYTPSGELDIRGLSGGETVALAIAIRIALAYTVFGKLPGFFILDEPTQFLDRDRRRAVFEIIKRVSEKMPQVIVVTHDTEVEELSDKIVYVFKEGGKSVVKEYNEVELEEKTIT